MVIIIVRLFHISMRIEKNETYACYDNSFRLPKIITGTQL